MFNSEIAIDFGAKNIKISSVSKGIIINEPAYIAVDKATRQVNATGREAYQMIGRAGSKTIVEAPFCGGRIKSFSEAEFVLNRYIKRIASGKMFLPAAAISIPFGITETERIAATNVIENAGIRKIAYIYEPIAAAIGAGMPVENAMGSMVVDIGGGTTEVAVISLGGIVTSKSLRVAGDAMDDAIVSYVKRTYNLMIGERTAEQMKMTIGTAYVDANTQEERMTIKGRDVMTGLPRTVEINNFQVAEAIYEPVMAMVDAIKVTLEKTPPELSADIMDNGIMLTGGGALLKGLDIIIEKSTGMLVNIADNPLDCVANGTGTVLEDLDRLKNVLVPARLMH